MWHSWLFFCRSFYKGCEMFWKTGPEGYICETKTGRIPGRCRTCGIVQPFPVRSITKK